MFFVLRSSFFFSSFHFSCVGKNLNPDLFLSLSQFFIYTEKSKQLPCVFFFHPFTAAVSELSLSPPSPPFSCFCKVCFTLPAFGSSCFSVSEKSYRFFLFVQSYVRVSMWLLASFFFPLFSTISVVFKKIK